MKDREQGLNHDRVALKVQAAARPGRKRRIIGMLREHAVEMDVSPQNGGEGAAPSPPEYLALSLAGCVVNLCRFMAAEKNCLMEGLEVAAVGTIDPAKARGEKTDHRAGFLDMSVTIQFETDMNENEKNLFIREVRERCPLCDTIGNATVLSIDLA